MEASPEWRSGTLLVLPHTCLEAVFSRALSSIPSGLSTFQQCPGVGQDAHKTHKGLRKVHWWLNNVYYLRTPSRTAVSVLAKFAESHFSGKKLDFQHFKKRSEFRPLFSEFVLSSHNRHNVPDCFISITGVQTSWWV